MCSKLTLNLFFITLFIILQVEGKVYPSPRTDHMLSVSGPESKCTLCKLNVNLKYTVSLIFLPKYR